jgi:RNAse (barnase) inhibitor barstar
MTILSTAALPEFFLKTPESYFLIDGDRIKDKESFLQEFSEQLEFPKYFGFNWDAFYDCITDMSWVNADNGFLIVYQNAHHFRIAQPDDWQQANAILLDAVEYWNKQGTLMMIAFL